MGGASGGRGGRGGNARRALHGVPNTPPLHRKQNLQQKGLQMDYGQIQDEFNMAFARINMSFDADLEGIRQRHDLDEESRALRGYLAAQMAGQKYAELLDWRDERVRSRREEIDSELF